MKTIKTLYITWLAFALLASGGIASLAHAETKTFEPSRDTYVDEALLNSSFGSIGLGTVGYQPSNSSSKITLLYFDISSIPNGTIVNSAKLTMRLGGCVGNESGVGNTSLGFYLANGSPAWTETSTYQQLSTSGSSLDIAFSQIVPCSPGSSIDFNMKEMVQYWTDRMIPNDGMILLPVNSAYWTRVFYMREATAASRPKLTIDYTIPAEEVTSPDGPAATPSPTSAPSVNTQQADSASQPIAPDLSLNAPTKLNAKQKGSELTIDLQWEKSNSDGTEAYRIFRKEMDSETVYQKIGEVDASNTTFDDTKVIAGKRYSYFVRSTRSGRESINSDTVSIDVRAEASANVATASTISTTNNSTYLYIIIALLILLVILIIILLLLHRKHRELRKKSQVIDGQV